MLVIISNMKHWIDIEPHINHARPLFIVERHDTSRGISTLVLRERPAATNMSHEDRLWGWCGTSNNVSVTAHGMIEVTKVSKDGTRALVKRLHGPKLRTALESLGYDELLIEGSNLPR